MNEEKSSGIFFTSLRSVLCVIMAGILAVSMIPITEQAYAANEEKADSVFLELGKISVALGGLHPGDRKQNDAQRYHNEHRTNGNLHGNTTPRFY